MNLMTRPSVTHHKAVCREKVVAEGPLTLSGVARGSRVRVVALTSEPAVCQRLREMGFCEMAEVAKLSDGGGLICQVCGSRVALSSRLADEIVVEPLPF